MNDYLWSIAASREGLGVTAWKSCGYKIGTRLSGRLYRARNTWTTGLVVPIHPCTYPDQTCGWAGENSVLLVHLGNR